MATGKTTGLFLLAEDGGGGAQPVGGRTLFGGVNSRWSEEGGGFRVGEVGGGGYGGVRIAGCGWVCQCHVSSLAPLASRLEGCWTES